MLVLVAHQLPTLAAAGFHAVAPDMRGYGKSDRPEAIDQYTISGTLAATRSRGKGYVWLMKSSVLPDPASTDDDEMRRRILGAAFKSFTENGYAGTSTLQIATRAKVSKRDLYALFASKQAMLVACIKTRSARMQLPSGLPVPRTRKLLVSTLVAFATNLLMETSHPDVIAMFRLGISEASRSPEVAQALDESREATRRTLIDLLIHAQSAGLLPSGDPAEMASEYLALLGRDVMLRLLLGVIARPGRAQIERHASQATDAFLRLR
jgi:AcrR family transcriptional regulator